MKWAGYVVIIYFLASWGVNGVVNPMHYVRYMMMRAEILELEERAEGIAIRMPEDCGAGSRYLSFRVAEAKEYSFGIKLSGRSKEGKWQEAEVPVWKGWNSVDICGYGWEEIVVPRDVAEREGIVLEDARVSAYRMVDMWKMAYVAGAFLAIVGFWECIYWVKRRYAE